MSTTVLERGKPDVAAKPATTIVLPPDLRLKVDADAFAALCAANRDMRLEREADGGLVVMSPASGESSRRNMTLGAILWNWNKPDRRGFVFESSAGFTLPDGSVLAPDVAWIQRDRWLSLPSEDRKRFPHIVPDFAAELRSPSDSIKQLRAKMDHYTAQGVRLAWLIDPETRTVEIHRPSRDVEILTKPSALSGEDVLPGLVVDLAEILYDVEP